MNKEKEEIPKAFHILVVIIGIGIVITGNYIAGLLVAGFGVAAYMGLVDPTQMMKERDVKNDRDKEELFDKKRDRPDLPGFF